MRIAVSLKAFIKAAYQEAGMFQSAVRIAVSLKDGTCIIEIGDVYVSIRRADRCLAEVLPRRGQASWLLQVSIRRADRCLAEVEGAITLATSSTMFQSAVRIAVSLKVTRSPLHQRRTDEFQSAVRIAVSLKMARR